MPHYQEARSQPTAWSMDQRGRERETGQGQTSPGMGVPTVPGKNGYD